MESKQYITKWPMDHWRNEIKIPRDKWKQNHNDPKPMKYSKSGSKREVYSNTILSKETRKIFNKQRNLTPIAIRKGRKNKILS